MKGWLRLGRDGARDRPFNIAPSFPPLWREPLLQLTRETQADRWRSAPPAPAAVRGVPATRAGMTGVCGGSAGIERALSPAISTSNTTKSTPYNFLPRTYPRRSEPPHTLGVPVAGGGRLDPARSGDGDGAERGRDGSGRRVEATSLSQKDGQTPSGSRGGGKRGSDRAGIRSRLSWIVGGRDGLADRPWSAPVRGLIGNQS
jgi:hypothetical protein